MACCQLSWVSGRGVLPADAADVPSMVITPAMATAPSTLILWPRAERRRPPPGAPWLDGPGPPAGNLGTRMSCLLDPGFDRVEPRRSEITPLLLGLARSGPSSRRSAPARCKYIRKGPRGRRFRCPRLTDLDLGAAIAHQGSRSRTEAVRGLTALAGHRCRR